MVGFSRALDLAFGVTQTVVALTGCTLNLLSFKYFATLKSRNAISEFFRRLYAIITLNDFLVCALIFPVIEDAFSSNRDGVQPLSYNLLPNNHTTGVLFSDDVFCNAWFFVYVHLPVMSIFLVGMLSVSRLLILKYPTRSVKPLMAYVIPGSCLCVLCVLTAGLMASDFMHATHFPQLLLCVPVYKYTSDTAIYFAQNTAVLVAVYNVIPALSIIPISVSFIFSLFYLRKSMKVSASSNVNSSTEKQQEATKTVVLVTLMYIVCNIPFAIAAVCFMMQFINVANGGSLSNSATVYYLSTTSFIFLITLNSMLNPIVYFFRIKHFRQHVSNYTSRIWSSMMSAPRVSTETGPTNM